MYEAVCLEKDRTIVALKAEVLTLKSIIDKPVAVTVELPKDFAIAQPAVVARKRKQKDASSQFEEMPAAPTLNLADCDENNPEVIARLAVLQYGRKPYNTYELNVWTGGIKTKIRAAKAEREREKRKKQSDPEQQEEVTLKELDDPVDESNVPLHIHELIAKNEARVN